MTLGLFHPDQAITARAEGGQQVGDGGRVGTEGQEEAGRMIETERPSSRIEDQDLFFKFGQ